MRNDSDILIIGGGMAGLSAGCYAQMNGWQAHIIEHNSELGGLCTSWWRDDYLIDGCIYWLMGAAEGGLFRSLYEELGVIRDVELKTIECMHRYEDPARDQVVELTRDLSAMRKQWTRLSPEDEGAIARIFEAVDFAGEIELPMGKPQELASLGDQVRQIWSARRWAGTLFHFRGSLAEWCDKHVRGAALRDYLLALLSPQMPALFLPIWLRQLADGQMSRPIGGSGAFRDAIAHRYRELGGRETLNTTVEEILIEGDKAVGVRFSNGAQLRSDIVISTSSAYETHLRLLGGRYLDRATREQLETWPTFEPIVLFSAGVAMPLGDLPPSLLIRQNPPLTIGNRENELLYLRLFNDDPSFAPSGHCVVQTMLPTSYDWWAQCGANYSDEKRRTEKAILGRIDDRIPGFRDAVRLTDLSTPLTFWRHARSWRGAYEGWLPTAETYRSHMPKTVSHLKGLYLAGQWVEPGGGIPPSLLSGRHVIQILSSFAEHPFRTSVPS